MTVERGDPTGGSPPAGDAPDAETAARDGYEGSGAWGTWALGLLLALFLLSAAATVHSIVVTFTG